MVRVTRTKYFHYTLNTDLYTGGDLGKISLGPFFSFSLLERVEKL